MTLYFVKRSVEANSIKEALEKERRAPVTDIWCEKTDISVIGFKTISSEL